MDDMPACFHLDKGVAGRKGVRKGVRKGGRDKFHRMYRSLSKWSKRFGSAVRFASVIR